MNKELLHQALEMCDHYIPSYAYSDSEAACELASRLSSIGHILAEAIAQTEQLAVEVTDVEVNTAFSDMGWLGRKENVRGTLKNFLEHRLAQPVQPAEPSPSAIWHMRDWITRLKRCSDDGKHMYIPCGLSSGMCWELAKELEQFVETVVPPKEPV